MQRASTIKINYVYGLAWTALFLLLASSSTYGQANANSSTAGLPDIPEITIDELRAPISPAFTLLDVSPSSVERPNTPRALALSLLSTTERSNGDFPKDLAIEFAPYWFVSHPSLTFEKYYSPAPIEQIMLRSLSISLATTDIDNQDNGDQDDGTRASVGVRFFLRSGGPASSLSAKVKKLKETQLAFLDLVPDTPGEPINTESAAYKKLEAELRSAGEAVRQLDKERVGWVIEFAGAISVDFPEDDTSEADMSRAGVWLTPSYRTANEKSLLHSFTFVGVSRYIWDDSSEDTENIFDLGGRVIWKSVYIPISLSVEYIHRFMDESGDTNKFVGVLEYKLFNFLSLIASYGKNFDDGFSGDDDLIATAGIKFGFGKGPILQ